MIREQLPARRRAVTFAFAFKGVAFDVQIGFHDDGRPGEVFVTGRKSGSDLQNTLIDAAIAISIAMQHVRDRILPAALANRDAVITSPVDLENIVAAHWRRQDEAARQESASRKVTEAVRVMPAGEHEVMMFGVRLWPRVDHHLGTYDYDQLCAAIWYFRDFDAWLSGSISGRTPGSRAIIVRLSTRWPQEYLDRAYTPEARGKIKKVYQLVHLLARLLEENPDGECVIPPTPRGEGQW